MVPLPESIADYSQVEMLYVRYQFVNVGAGKEEVLDTARKTGIRIADALLAYPEYSRDNSYPWSPSPPEAGPSRTRSSHRASCGVQVWWVAARARGSLTDCHGFIRLWNTQSMRVTDCHGAGNRLQGQLRLATSPQKVATTLQTVTGCVRVS